MASNSKKKQPVVVTNDVTGEIKYRGAPPSINKAAKFVGRSLAHIARCLVKDKKYKGKGYTIRISD